MNTLTPREIVRELDRYIIGQADAKKAVAVALRNRYRRAMLPEDIREEVTPKNILMVGPPGVGKTEIARRLAKLVDAPFVKVEATKFTEVGYVGRDVESIIRDLIEAAIRLLKSEHAARVQAVAIDGHAEQDQKKADDDAFDGTHGGSSFRCAAAGTSRGSRAAPRRACRRRVRRYSRGPDKNAGR